MRLLFSGVAFIFQLVLDAKSLTEDDYCSVTVPQLYTYMYILAVVGELRYYVLLKLLKQAFTQRYVICI